MVSSSSEPLWRSYAIVQILDCLADPEKNRIVAELSDDVSAVFPYLNAVLPQAMFNAGANSLTVRRGAAILTLYVRVAVLAKVTPEEAEEGLEWLRSISNDVWARRDVLTPLYKRRVIVGPIDVYKLLPQLNCWDCGERTCMAFACMLLLGQRRLAECTRGEEPAYAEGIRRLRELLGS